MKELMLKLVQPLRTSYTTNNRASMFLSVITLIGLVLILSLISSRSIFRGNAQTTTSMEAENAVLANGAITGTDQTASNSQYVQLGNPSIATTFQPSAPYYTTFYYAWYKAPIPDGSYSYWPDYSNTPPTSWFSHYLPDVNSSTFDPSSELYSTNNYNIFKWQVSKMAEAKIEVAIASWWGQGGKEDLAINNIINDFMGRSDNPYPNLRWGFYYECEGIANTACGGTSDPSVSKIVSDLTYIKNTYGNSPYLLKINGKPVIFVYADANDIPGTMVQRWADANSQVGNAFYYVLKVFPGFATASPQPSSWHQYAPAVRSDSQGPYSLVSPGFWIDDNVSAVRLPRDATAFETAVQSMVAATGKTWKMVQTWNEWGEGTAVEPGDETMKDATGKEVLNPNGAPFKNLYIDILNRNLPPLEAGTGSNAATVTPQPTPTPTQIVVATATPTRVPTATPTPTTSALQAVTIVAAGDISCGAGSTGATCRQMDTSNIFAGTNPLVVPDAVLTLGDTQYESGELSDWLNYFDPTWGRVINKIYPTMGNHEYNDPAGGAKGTFDYFESKFGVGSTSKRPGARTQGYYAFDLGAWRLYSLNTQCSSAGGCGAGSPQETWLRADLSAHPNKCVLAFYHIPLYSSGGRANQNSQALWKALYDYHADVILAGHDHSYERFYPMDQNAVRDDANGILSFVVGTGGRNFTPFVLDAPNSVIRNADTMGVLKMTLNATSYSWQFIRANYSGNGTFTDSGTRNCI